MLSALPGSFRAQVGFVCSMLRVGAPLLRGVFALEGTVSALRRLTRMRSGARRAIARRAGEQINA